MRSKLLDRLRKPENTFNRNISWLKSIVSGSVYRAANAQNLSVLDTIKSQVDVMRALATDSQISAALSYYATDATTKNSAGQIIWAVPIDSDSSNVADIVNDLFKRWKINNYAREHILELATYGNLYLPTTDLYRTTAGKSKTGIALDNNTILDEEYDIIPSSQLLPEDVLHIWQYGEPVGYIYRPDDGSKSTTIYPLFFFIRTSCSSQYAMASWIVLKGIFNVFETSLILTSLLYFERKTMYKYTFM